MAHVLRFELRAGFKDFRKWIARMLVSVPGECAERLQLADGTQPASDRGSVSAAPSLDCKREMSGPEKWRRDQSEDCIQAVIQQIGEAFEPGDLSRGRTARCIECCVKLSQFCGSKPLPLESCENE